MDCTRSFGGCTPVAHGNVGSRQFLSPAVASNITIKRCFHNAKSSQGTTRHASRRLQQLACGSRGPPFDPGWWYQYNQQLSVHRSPPENRIGTLLVRTKRSWRCFVASCVRSPNNHNPMRCTYAHDIEHPSLGRPTSRRRPFTSQPPEPRPRAPPAPPHPAATQPSAPPDTPTIGREPGAQQPLGIGQSHSDGDHLGVAVEQQPPSSGVQVTTWPVPRARKYYWSCRSASLERRRDRCTLPAHRSAPSLRASDCGTPCGVGQTSTPAASSAAFLPAWLPWSPITIAPA